MIDENHADRVTGWRQDELLALGVSGSDCPASPVW